MDLDDQKQSPNNMKINTAKKILKKSGDYLLDKQPLAQLYRWARDDASDKDIEHLQYWTYWNLGIYSGFSHGGKAQTYAANCAVVKANGRFFI